MNFISHKLSALKKKTAALQEALTHYLSVNASTLAASLAYYTLFSLAPLLIIAVAIVGFVYGKEAAEGQIIDQLSDYIGPRTAHFLQQLILRSFTPASGITATVISSGILIYGASTIFSQLRFSLNTIWNVRQKNKLSVIEWIKMMAFPCLLVIMSGFVLLASTIVNTLIQTLAMEIDKALHSSFLIVQASSFFIDLGITTVIFALIFKYVSSAIVAWRVVWIGALFTASLFSLLKIFLVFYFSRAAHISIYGAAASLVILLLWLNYTSQVIFLGAEFIRMYSIQIKCPIIPSSYASYIKSPN
jgi:membrane protein